MLKYGIERWFIAHQGVPQPFTKELHALLGNKKSTV